MSTYQVSGQAVSMPNGSGSAVISVNDSINPLTGASGVTTVKLTNTSTSLDTVAVWQNLDATYTYANVPVSSTSYTSGTGATFDVTITSNGCIVTINNGGINYSSDELPNLPRLVLDGASLGGTSGENDLLLDVTQTTLFPDYIITSVSIWSQNPNWPQSYLGSIPVLPLNTTFVQVTSGNQPASVYFSSIGGDSDLIVQPVSVVG